eukprot:PhM_4_TR2474/c0_g1_i3/m.6702
MCASPGTSSTVTLPLARCFATGRWWLAVKKSGHCCRGEYRSFAASPKTLRTTKTRALESQSGYDWRNPDQERTQRPRCFGNRSKPIWWSQSYSPQCFSSVVHVAAPFVMGRSCRRRLPGTGLAIVIAAGGSRVLSGSPGHIAGSSQPIAAFQSARDDTPTTYSWLFRVDILVIIFLFLLLIVIWLLLMLSGGLLGTIVVRVRWARSGSSPGLAVVQDAGPNGEETPGELAARDEELEFCRGRHLASGSRQASNERPANDVAPLQLQTDHEQHVRGCCQVEAHTDGTSHDMPEVAGLCECLGGLGEGACYFQVARSPHRMTEGVDKFRHFVVGVLV